MLRRILTSPYFGLTIAALWCVGMLGFAMVRETPVGTVEGQVIAADTGKPIASAQVILRPKSETDSDEYDDSGSRYQRTSSDGTFRIANVTAGNYTIQAYSDVHTLQASQITIREGDTQKLNLELQPNEPYLNLYVHQQMFTTNEKPEVVLDGFTQGDTAKITLSKVNVDKLFSAEASDIRVMLSSDYYGDGNRPAPTGPAIESVETINVQITDRDNEGVYHQNVTLPVQQPGIYILTAQAGDLSETNWISISDISLITKESGSDILAYVVGLKNGEPVSGADISVLEGNSTIDDGKTDAKGLWGKRLKSPAGGRENRLILARYDNSTAIVSSESYTPYSESDYGETGPGDISIYTYTDRPVYRPGQTVYFKGIIRKFTKDAYHLPGQGSVRVEVKDRRDTMVYAADLPLSRFGSFHNQFTLPEFAATGSYDVTCSYQGKDETTDFQVSEYRKPEFSVTVEMPKKRCVRGERIKAKIRADYFFGAPVVGAEVSYSVDRSDYWLSPDEGDMQGYSDYGDYGEALYDKTTKTGPDGTAEIEFTANWEQPKDTYGSVDQQFTVSAVVTDQNHQQSDAEGSIIATQGDFKVSLTPVEYVTSPGKSAQVMIQAVDYNHKPQSGVVIEVSAGRLNWDDDEEHFTETSSRRITTDSSGKAVFAFIPNRSGDYSIRASCRDRGRRLIKSSTDLWVTGEGDMGGYKYPNIEVVLDRATYNPGDTAKVLINTDKTGAVALVTTEGRRLFDYRQVRLDKKSTTIEIPIKDEYKPNFYVNVCFVRDKEFISQDASAKVSLAAQSVKLSVTPDKKRYEPGEQATYLVKAVDSRNKPVQAEVSLGVVDESIYQIMEDQTPEMREFFYSHLENSVSTHYSAPGVYYSGDKAGFTGKVRKNFVDTAFWQADVVTDDRGEARVHFKMPDNLTTWRATARACTIDTAVGEAKSTTICAKKLLVRLETPRFLVQKDNTVITALVHNYLNSAQSVRVALKAPGLEIKDPLERTITVDRQGMGRVEWRVTANRVGTVRLIAYAVSKAAQDAMELPLPVHPQADKLIESSTGSVISGRTASVRLNVRGDALPGMSEIRIRMAPSLASAMLGSLDYLAEYPYGCTEQTISTFLPDVVVWQTLKSLGISKPDLQKRLPVMVGRGLNRIYDFQNEDGGWGWCQYGKPDLWMTSYAVYGLLTARSAGFPVNQDILKNGTGALERGVVSTRANDPNKVWALYVLALAGNKNVVSQQLQPILEHGVGDPHRLALVTMTLAAIGDAERAKTYMTQLWDYAIVGSDGETHWSQPEDSRYYEPDTETTALGLMAATKINPDDPRIAQIVRWLLNQREYDHWYSTRDTAMVLYAVSDYLARTKETQPSFTATVLQNGQQVASVQFDKNSLFAPEKEVVISKTAIRKGNNTIQLRMSGQGMLYFTTELTQYVARNEQLLTINGSGITIRREYHKLKSRWNESLGADRLQPEEKNSTAFKSGDSIHVKLIVNSPSAYSRVLVEDYLPAGFEAFDRGSVEPWEWTYWWVDMDVRDDRVSFYVDNLPRGGSVLEYDVRATTPGTFMAMPPILQAMYQPSVSASGMGMTVSVKD